MNFKTYLFDFDGTLVDSMPAYISVMLRILDENNISYESDIVKTITPLGYKGTAEYFKSLGVDMSVSEMMTLMNTYAFDEYKYRIEAKKNVIDTLKKLKENHEFSHDANRRLSQLKGFYKDGLIDRKEFELLMKRWSK